jgi:2-polyprenyl-3-methyl-5-hydroxy-6-metoxy-1,4-benzoquinol methylase
MTDWDEIYKNKPLEEIAWHSDIAPDYLKKLVENDRIKIGKVLDVCSGAGTNSIFLAKKGFDVTGVDISPTAIEIAKQRAIENGVGNNCNFFVSDVLDNGFPQHTFDFILDRGCYHHIAQENKPKFIEIIFNSLKEGGHYSLTCFSDKNVNQLSHPEKIVTKKEIYENFGTLFTIKSLNEDIWIQPNGKKIHFYIALMKKK